MKQYEEYKDSGVEWIGRVPGHWEVERIKTIYKERTELSEDGKETLMSVSEYYGVEPKANFAEEGEYLSRAATLVGYKKCFKGDFVSNIMLAWKGSFGVTKYDGIVSPAYCVYKPSSEIYSPFFHYLFRTSFYTGRFKSFSHGIMDSRLRLYSPEFYDVEAIIPPLPEQRAVVEYLDGKCEEIDKMVAKKQARIALLGELKQSLITRAVTKGLNLNAKMKPSGVDWIGEVPENWELKRGKFCTKLRSGYPFDSNKFTNDAGYIGLIRIRDISNDTTEINYVGDYPKDALVTKGDVLIGMDGEFNVAKWKGADALLNQRVCKVLDTPKVLSHYLFYLLPRPLKCINDVTYSTTVKHLSTSDIANSVIPVPPLPEQQRIAAYLAAKCAAIDTSIAKAEKEIALLGELKQSLITEVVTGKRCVVTD